MGGVHHQLTLFSIRLRTFLHWLGVESPPWLGHLLYLLQWLRFSTVASLGYRFLLYLLALTLMVLPSLRILWGVLLLRVMSVPPHSMGGTLIIMGGPTSAFPLRHQRQTSGVRSISLGGFPLWCHQLFTVASIRVLFTLPILGTLPMRRHQWHLRSLLRLLRCVLWCMKSCLRLLPRIC